jgi:putative ABC transport system permease protein
MVENQEATTKVAALVERNTTDLKCETQAAGLARHLAPYQDLLRGVRFILVPALVIVMTVIVANSISITARERTAEVAILKVLGFRRSHLLLFVLGEVLLVGSLAGLGGGALTYWLINMRGGIKIALGFFPVFWVPAHACWWGMLLGAFTALLGGFLPAWNASAVRVSETFSRAA